MHVRLIEISGLDCGMRRPGATALQEIDGPLHARDAKQQCRRESDVRLYHAPQMLAAPADAACERFDRGR